MFELLPTLLVVAVAAPMLAAAFAGATTGSAACRRAALATAVGAGAAIVAFVVSVATGGVASLGPLGLNPFRSLLLILVLGVGATVLSFASRSLRGESYQARFARIGAGVGAVGAIYATADDLIVIGAAWVATSALVVALVRTGPSSSTDPSRRARRALLLSDALVVVGLGLLIAHSGSTALDSVDPQGPTAALAGVCLVIAAAARGATVPFHRWLPDTVAAPTPASALLHAGVVNGGAVLVLLLGPVVSGRVGPALVAVVLGSVGCAFAEAVMLTRPDVKSRLAWSTIAQMSFTLVLCGAGLRGAAALHLVAHGAYKAALFLGSGSGVRAIERSRRSRPAAPAHPAALVGTAVALGLVAGAVLMASDLPRTAELLVPVALAWITTCAALAGFLGNAPSARSRRRAVIAFASALAAFVFVAGVLKGWLAPTLGGQPTALPVGVIVPVLGALGLIAATSGTPERTRWSAAAWEAARRAGRPRPLVGSVRTTPTPVAPSAAPTPPLADPVEPAVGDHEPGREPAYAGEYRA